MGLDTERTYDEEMAEQLKQCLSYQYPYEADINLYTKITVSELKRLGQEAEEFDGLSQPEAAAFLWEEAGKESGQGDTEPDGGGQKLKKQTKEEAAKRGTAYHRILELLDFTAVSAKEDVVKQFRGLLADGRISEAAIEKVRPDGIWRLAASPLGRRIARAQAAGRCRREQQFVMGIPARDIGAGDSEELVLIQGIIDAYLEEEDGLVLIDYKTDYILQGQEEILIKRYGKQMDYYQKALEQIAGKRVKERIIYSFSLNKEVPL